MNEIAEKDPLASFGFIGANMIGESEAYTKRFRVYERFMASYFNNEHYEHVINYQKSAYMLLSKEALAVEPDLTNILVQGFHDLYPYFE